jgi:hypothetical protein
LPEGEDLESDLLLLSEDVVLEDAEAESFFAACL